MLPKLAIFVSGSGTNMENILRAIRAGKIPAEAALVVCDKPGAPAIAKAEKYGVRVALVDRKTFPSKEAFEAEMTRQVRESGADWLILAGFMRILSPEFVNRFPGRILNVHPSMLPAFPGAHAIRDAFEARVQETGVTTHFVTAEVDAGPVILQKKVPILPGDTLEALEARVHAAEYELYPEAIRRVIANKKSCG
ncbi:MAG: phosphoribosylglycinamide formyltransferase [Candidatus Omnitrophota bacterium]